MKGVLTNTVLAAILIFGHEFDVRGVVNLVLAYCWFVGLCFISAVVFSLGESVLQKLRSGVVLFALSISFLTLVWYGHWATALTWGVGAILIWGAVRVVEQKRGAT